MRICALGKAAAPLPCFKFFDEAMEAYEKLPTFEKGNVEAYKPFV